MSGLGVILCVRWRTQRTSILVWVLALAASMVGTAAGIAGLYNTPAKIHTYAVAVTSGSSLVAINGRVEGIDSLGGVIQDEFGFMAAFLMPLLGISLVARATRREEESGRTEALLGGRVSRHVPVVAALLVATAAILVTALLFAAGLGAYGVPLARACLYAASLAALAFVFSGLAALLAQLSRHSRAVYGYGLTILALAYVLRGVGDVTKTWLTWLSPLGWAEKAAPFGVMRWWTLLIPILLGLLLSGAAIAMAARRDLGSSLSRADRGPARASRWLRSPLGLAVRIGAPSFLGSLAGALILAAMMGSLTRQFIDALLGNPSMGTAIGLSTTAPVNGFVAVVQLYTAIIAMGYVVQAVATLRGEETDGRLEPRLAGRIRRLTWLAAHVIVILTGLVVLVVASSLTLELTLAWSMSRSPQLWPTVAAGLAYLPAELLVLGVALALFGVAPRLLPAAWAVYAGVAFIGLLGPALRLASWILDLGPTTHVGNPPAGTVKVLPLAVMAAVSVALALFAAAGFRLRRVPQG